MLHSYPKCLINLLFSMLAQSCLLSLGVVPIPADHLKENELPVGTESRKKSAIFGARGGGYGTTGREVL